MYKSIKEWGDNLKIVPPVKGKDTHWDKIAGRIKSKKGKVQTFWDDKILLIAVILLAAIIGSMIIIHGITSFNSLLGV
jgi:hypothetical protein